MSDEQSLVSGDLAVNEATLEYFRLKIEQDVKRRLLQSIGLPAVGTGVVALAVAFWLWIPAQIRDVIESPQVSQHFQAAATQFIASDDGKRLIETEIRDDVAESLRAYFETSEGAETLNTTLATELPGRLTMYFRDGPGKQVLQDLMDRPEHREMLVEVINSVLAPALAGLGEEIRERIEEPLARSVPDADFLAKGGVAETIRRIERDHVPGNPVLLTLTVAQGAQYRVDALGQLHRALGDRYPDDYRGVVLTDLDGRFVGRVPRARLDRALAHVDPEFVRDLIPLVNEGAQEALVDLLASTIGETATAAVEADMPTMDALRSTAWGDPSLDADVAVLGPDGALVGLPSRREVIEGLVWPEG